MLVLARAEMELAVRVAAPRAAAQLAAETLEVWKVAILAEALEEGGPVVVGQGAEEPEEGVLGAADRAVEALAKEATATGEGAAGVAA